MANAAGRAKPVVAVKTAKVGEGVSKYAEKHLNLSTLLDEMEAAIQKNRKFNLVTRKQEVLQELRESSKRFYSGLR